ncbi:hypothetical protein SLA2020_030450 [Shorea laevis]
MINTKAISMLQCALNPTAYNRVSGCDTAKEIWDMLEATHEGTNQVKESKINRLIYRYELFKMKPEESIQEMFTRLNDIVNSLKALGKVYPPQEVVRKVLRSLPKSWEAKKTAIEESKDPNTLKVEDLIGKLMTYDIEVQVDGGVEVVEKKKKDVAFKVSNQKEKSEDDASDGENFSSLISREVRRFMKKNIKSKLVKRDEGESTKKSVKCYECNKIGHYRNECPKLKKGEKKGKKSMKKKSFAATWSDDETSSTESESSLEKGVANLCFMAQKDSNNDEEVNSNFSSLINESSFEYSYDDLCKVLDCSMNDIKRRGNENLALTKTISLLKNEIESLSKQNEVLVKENASLNGEIASLKNEEVNDALKRENEDLKKENEVLNKENEVLKKEDEALQKEDEVLKKENEVLRKENEDLKRKTWGIGFDYFKKQKTFKTSFVRASQSSHPKVTCYCCGEKGHYAYACPLKRLIAQGKVKQIWVPKGTIRTNPQGPKQIWVPKIKN